ncbi:glycine-rich protein [Conexibacter woesei]|uniref:receptor protein-tyrosine kinase n=1 Tax=Conexibacter woesei (strain DSM 14684 / CCUG 47730 / CIP 108061 / JCM 11494 / NBRC 100937 / ID131577) TaxID=469383 RepID=D3FF36_CONWI|nr:hypothetical protein [Conexibacter woesei]ADB51753.1 hypothetical protein Cwoe_3335 [Conexibacter woesei DSM 14684]
MHRARRSLAALAVAAAGSAIVAGSAVAAPVQRVFQYNGPTPQVWTAPAGVTEATFTLVGASGAAAAGSGAAGGFGAQIVATLPVTPGQAYELVVGGQGTGATGGFNGGGAGGANTLVAGGGGGATDVRLGTGAPAAARLLVAAGGGGGGAAGTSATLFGVGGVGGSATNNGAAGAASGSVTAGGGGLTLGTGGTAGRDGTSAGAQGLPGNGTGVGGAGAAQAPIAAGGNGGGGGGGYIGGGGGGAGASNLLLDGAGGGGGAGGQNYLPPNAPNPTVGLSDLTGNGVAIVSYEPLAAPAVRTQPTLSGVGAVGRELTCELGTWSGSPSLAVAWLRNGTAISGATTARYTLATADGGQQVACQVTATNSAGSTIARTPALGIPAAAAPAASVLPRVSGVAAIRGRLTCIPGTWSGAPTFTYTWLRNGAPISGATSATYSPVTADAGQVLQCAVRATATGLSTTAQSVATGGPPRLVILSTVALVSRSGAVTVTLGCFGPTACRVPRVTVTSGQVIARAGARTVRAGGTSRVELRLGRRGVSKLRSAGSSIPVRFVSTPTGGYGGNARLQFVALRGATLG